MAENFLTSSATVSLSRTLFPGSWLIGYVRGLRVRQ